LDLRPGLTGAAMHPTPSLIHEVRTEALGQICGALGQGTLEAIS
jgi:hypothetical protein